MDRHGRNFAVRRLRRQPRRRARRPGLGPARSAIKIWDKREFKDFSGAEELGPRNIRIALRRLRKFAREGAEEELDLDGTIRSTADKGYIDVKLRPERRNAVKVLLFLDVGGSMDWHVAEADALFSAARLQFKRLEHFYFHNCVYESVWRNNRRRFDERTPTADLINLYGRDYRVIFVGDAAMSPYEIIAPGGSVEHLNPESRRDLAQARGDHLAAQRLDQPDAAGPMALFAVRRHHFRVVRRPHVRPDARWRRSRDARAGALRLGSRARKSPACCAARVSRGLRSPGSHASQRGVNPSGRPQRLPVRNPTHGARDEADEKGGVPPFDNYILNGRSPPSADLGKAPRAAQNRPAASVCIAVSFQILVGWHGRPRIVG